MSKKRILFLYTNMHIGGAQKHIVDLAIGFKNIKNVTSFVGSQGGKLIEELKSNNIRHSKLLVHSINPLVIIINIFRIINFINNNKINVIHSHHRYTNMLTFFVKKIVSKNKNFISTAHNVFPNLHQFGFWHKKTICVSNPVKKYISSISNARTEVIHNSVLRKRPTLNKNHLKEDIGISNDKIVIVNIGRLTSQKSQSSIVKIVKSLENNNIEFDFIVLVVGDGPEREKISNLIKVNKLQSKIKLLGERNDIENILSIADIFILTSKWEGFPLTILEAASFGLPIISTDVGGINDFIIDNKNGYLVKKDDLDEFSEKLSFLITNKNLCKQLGNLSKEIFEESFSMKKFINDTFNFYEL